MDLFTTLLLIAVGIGISEIYHARMGAMVRGLRGSQKPNVMRAPIKKRSRSNRRTRPMDQLFRASAYPAPAAKLYRPHLKELSLQEWHYQQSLRKHTQRWPLREGRAA